MIDFVDKKGQLPPELELSLDCREFGALPCAGGLLDQPAGLMKKLRIVKNVYDAWLSWTNRVSGHEKEWVDGHPQYWQIVQDILNGRY